MVDDGIHIWVDKKNGDDANDGLTPETAMKTEAAAMEIISAREEKRQASQKEGLSSQVVVYPPTFTPVLEVSCLPQNEEKSADFITDITTKDIIIPPPDETGHCPTDCPFEYSDYRDQDYEVACGLEASVAGDGHFERKPGPTCPGPGTYVKQKAAP